MVSASSPMNPLCLLLLVSLASCRFYGLDEKEMYIPPDAITGYQLRRCDKVVPGYLGDELVAFIIRH